MIIRWPTVIPAAFAALILIPTAQAMTPRAYAQQQAARQGWTGYEWKALDAIVMRESAWNPCASYPRRHDCGYAGSNSCGIPQANPCPQEWRGRLGSTWRAQVDWLIRYIRSHGYGSPSAAWVYWQVHGSY